MVLRLCKGALINDSNLNGLGVVVVVVVVIKGHGGGVVVVGGQGGVVVVGSGLGSPLTGVDCPFGKKNIK